LPVTGKQETNLVLLANSKVIKSKSEGINNLSWKDNTY
jgi:hypothetical protein